MAASVETPSPTFKEEEARSSMASPPFSPSSDQRFWSSLHSRVDALIAGKSSFAAISSGGTGRAKHSKEDALLLMRGFDSVAQTLSQLSNNLDSALQGANDLAKPPTLTEIFHSSLENPEREEDESGNRENELDLQTGKCLKRKYDISHCVDELEEEDSKNEKEQDDGKLKKAKNLAVSMATKAASLARELRSMKSDLRFVQDRCALVEEENRRLRDGFSKGIRPEEDDLVRLQLEALLAEKSRLANENATLVRENQCLSQLVEYHQMTSSSQGLSASEYEQVMTGMCLDFSSPPRHFAGEDEDRLAGAECFQTPADHLNE